MTVHDFPPFYNGLGAFWLKKCIGIPTVLEIHHIIGWPKASSLTEYAGRILSEMILPSHCRRFDAVRVVNSEVKNILSSWGVSEKSIHVVPSFYLDHALIATAKNQPKTYDLVFCSRLVDNKRLLPVIDVLEQLPEATLLVVGDGPMRKKAEMRAQKFGRRVTFTGWLPSQADVLKHVASGKIFIMNSSSEGGPRAAIEAMALGLPLLTTRVGVMPDVVRDGVNGQFTDGTENDIAMKAKTLLADSGRISAMGLEAAKVTQSFEKTAAIRTYANFLQSQVH
jgi:glycosyltransferase involved in cell wall biosynthesis